jgi:hypothetical protein
MLGAGSQTDFHKERRKDRAGRLKEVEKFLALIVHLQNHVSESTPDGNRMCTYQNESLDNQLAACSGDFCGTACRKENASTSGYNFLHI